MRDYQLASPSLDGILHHDSIVYEGIRRPQELLRVMDRKIITKTEESTIITGESDQKVIEQYFNDLYSLFMKKLSFFIADSELRPDEGVKLQALLQEMIKIKRLQNYAK